MTLFNFLGGLGLGAGAAYFLDPDLGRRRRSLIRDQMVSLQHRAEDAYGKASRDLQHRVEGTFAEVNSLFTTDNAPDHVVRERVRAKLGRFVSHPHAVEVDVDDGRVTLRGPILSTEVERFVNAAYGVPGVQHVVNQLEVHEQPDISALQGGKQRAGQKMDLMQENWAPATRLLIGGFGGGLMLNCLGRRDPIALLLGTAGFFMSVRALTNTSLGRLLSCAPGASMQQQMQLRRRSGPSPHQTERFDTQEAAGMPAGVHETSSETRMPYTGI
jgi:hypothetical protein